MKLVGTIFASESQLAAFDAFSDQQKQARESRSKTSDLANFSKRIVDGETRWYDGENRFAVINSAGRRLWFTKRRNDWFAE